jgi:hypothetical protein
MLKSRGAGCRTEPFRAFAEDAMILTEVVQARPSEEKFSTPEPMF